GGAPARLAQADPARDDPPGVQRDRRDHAVALQARHGDRHRAQRNPRPGRRGAAGVFGQDAGVQAGADYRRGLMNFSAYWSVWPWIDLSKIDLVWSSPGRRRKFPSATSLKPTDVTSLTTTSRLMRCILAIC